MYPMATLFSSPHKGEQAFQAGDYATAVKELLPLAHSGNATAQYYIARMLQEGKGLPEDKKAAFSWAQKAAAQEDGAAEALLGIIYAQGRGVPRDDNEAARWFHKAAARGNAIGQSKMGMCCLHGVGVPKDSVKAYMWFDLAASASTGHDYVCNCDLRDTIATLGLTPAQIAEAKKQAREWKATEPTLLHRLHVA
jgi:TPR repeat protein